MRRILTFILLLAAATTARAQTSAGGVSGPTQQRTLLERLGYPSDAKLLIVHADDLGMAHSVDAATEKALATGLVTSGSIMVPCPWFPEIADYARTHADADLGLHLTLTSEWKFYRWGPVTAKDRVASLINAEGFLYPTEMDTAAHADPREVEAEIRAQVERARAFGVRPTHLDSHMGTLYQNQALFAVLLRVAHDNHLPVRISREMFASAPYLPSLLAPDDVVLDHIVTIGPDVTPERWADFYADAIKSLRPGVTEFVIHLAYDDEEMRAATIEHPGWGAAWRQRDFDFFTGERFRQLLKENNVRLITWRELGRLLAKPRI
ncbi:MAG: polysaccharide deacetylase family protein [Acidobacteriota bacterium]|nr:polysaccharide deacetylase family protein [Acidobacteriota bacterium]MDQ5837077.1 polysaccharide deacetylase family protein [Acidobacteriota bacterium]